MLPLSRTSALKRLEAFIPDAGEVYTSGRNFDASPGASGAPSGLSAALRLRLVSEHEVIKACLEAYSPQQVDKFVSEVIWRTYWKGWLAQRPSVWEDYCSDLSEAERELGSSRGLQTAYTQAIEARSGIDCFDHWATQLLETGYLHNHARMWFASIWIFTLRLPWTLGAAFFLRHLLDGDTASNTLSWRWVAGLQTRGKHYLARPSNIKRYTRGKFNPVGLLNTSAEPVDGPLPPEPSHLEDQPSLIRTTQNPTAWYLDCDDLWGGLEIPMRPDDIILLNARKLSDSRMDAPNENIARLHNKAMTEAIKFHHVDSIEIDLADCQLVSDELNNRNIQCVHGFSPHVGLDSARVGHWSKSLAEKGVSFFWFRRRWDSQLFPYANKGFFGFKKSVWPFIEDLSFFESELCR